MGEFMKIKLLVLLMMTLLGATTAFAGCDIKLSADQAADGGGTVNACDYADKEIPGLSKEAVETLNKALASCKCDVDNKEITQVDDANGAHCASGRTAKVAADGTVTIKATDPSTVVGE